MNKKVKGISFIVLGMFLTYLLVNRRGIEASNNSEGNFLFLFLNFFTLLTGKMAWIIIGLIFVAGLAYLIKKEVKISRKKRTDRSNLPSGNFITVYKGRHCDTFT